MKKMQIFEPAMCCSTGLCGVGVNPELLRISTVLNTLKQNGIVVDRFNLNSAPMEFIKNKAVNEFINTNEPDKLPIIILDEKIVIFGRYPTNKEFIILLELPNNILKEENSEKTDINSCKGGCCE